MTYDIIIPAPGAAMRKSYMELEKLRRRQYPFEMKESIRDITDKIYDKEAKPHYLVLAEKYNTIVPFYPGDFRELITSFHSDLAFGSLKIYLSRWNLGMKSTKFGWTPKSVRATKTAMLTCSAPTSTSRIGVTP
jgi:hypothetical protein